MGGRDSRKLVSFRANDQELAAIEHLVKDSGLTKQDYLLKAALGAIAHTPLVNADSSIKGATAKGLRLLSSADSSSPKFEEGLVIDGQNNKTYKLLWASFEASQKLGKDEYHLSNKLGVICKVVGKSRAKYKKLKVWLAFPGDQVRINRDGTFLKDRGNEGIEWFTESELAETTSLLEATSPVESSYDEIAIEAIKVASSPSYEAAVEQPIEAPKQMKQTEFREWLNIPKDVAGNNAFGAICVAGSSADGYAHKDGSVWFKSGNGKKAMWSTEAPQVSSKQLSLVLV